MRDEFDIKIKLGHVNLKHVSELPKKKSLRLARKLIFSKKYVNKGKHIKTSFKSKDVK